MKTNRPRGRLTNTNFDSYDKGRITAQQALSCLSSDKTLDAAVGYECFTNPEIRDNLLDFNPHSEMPVGCLRYLLRCISLDVEAQVDGYLHSQAEAIWELGVPMDEFWVSNGVAMSWNTYWHMIEDFLRQSYPLHYERITTHFLEGVDRELNFGGRISQWEGDRILAKYLDETVRLNVRGLN